MLLAGRKIQMGSLRSTDAHVRNIFLQKRHMKGLDSEDEEQLMMRRREIISYAFFSLISKCNIIFLVKLPGPLLDYFSGPMCRTRCGGCE